METKAEVYIPLGHGKVAVIDFEDFEKVRGFNFRYFNGGGQTEYAQTGAQKSGGYLHRVIWGEENIPPGFEIAHKDGDGLNCRGENLRCLTHQQNMWGKVSKKSNATSRYRGVCWRKRDRRWWAQIGLNGKAIYLGSFGIEMEAAKAYDAAAIKYFGEHAAPNFPVQKENPRLTVDGGAA